MSMVGCKAAQRITTIPPPTTEITTAHLEERTEYDEDSTIKVVYQVQLKTDVREGFYREYDAFTGALVLESQYERGRIEGISTLYYLSGAVSGIFRYEKGKLHGVVKNYYENGQVMEELLYKAGALTGVAMFYDDDGQRRETLTYVDGVTNGPFKEYYPNGKLKARGTYVTQGEEELEQGLLLLYNKRGALEQRLACQLGQCCVLWTAQDGLRSPSSDACKKIIKDCNCQ